MNLVHAIFEPTGDKPHPTILAMHGWGSNALDLLGLAPYIADGRCLVLCPQGPVEVSIGAVNGYGWYELRPGVPPDIEAMATAADHLMAFVDSASRRYPIDPRRFALMGFSQGGVMAYNLAIRYPERFAALAALSTWFPETVEEQSNRSDALRQLPTLVQHGRADDVVEIGRARRSVERLQALGIPLKFREYGCGHEITVEVIRDLSNFVVERVIQPANRNE